MTGFVGAMKPLKQARAGRHDAALASLASSAFRRAARLVLPATIATLGSWALCQVGGYMRGRLVQSEWMVRTCPEPSGGVVRAVQSLGRNVFNTWAGLENRYDANQWAMPWFFKASVLLFATLLATVRATPGCRMVVFMGLYAFSWACKERKFGSVILVVLDERLMWNSALVDMTVFGGALLAEISLQPSVINIVNRRSLASQTLPFLVVAVGFFFCSYPSKHAEWLPWSFRVLRLGEATFPKGAELPRFWPTVGAQIVTVGVVFSSRLQELLSHPILVWLGSVSFPVYLLHGPLLRSVLVWMLYAFVPAIRYEVQAEDGTVLRTFEQLPNPPAWRFAVMIPLFFAILLYAAYWWTEKIEPWCAWATKKMEDVMCGNEDDEKTLPILNFSHQNGELRVA